MKKNIAQILLIAALLTSFTACKKDDPTHEHENEFINAIRVEFSKDGETQTFDWIEGGIKDTISLLANTTYEAKVYFLHFEHEEHDITPEIEEEGDKHQVFITTNPTNLLQINYTDKDKNGKPIGIESNISSVNSGTGSLRILLKHYTTTKDGNPSNGSTDVDIIYPIIIK